MPDIYNALNGFQGQYGPADTGDDDDRTQEKEHVFLEMHRLLSSGSQHSLFVKVTFIFVLCVTTVAAANAPVKPLSSLSSHQGELQ